MTGMYILYALLGVIILVIFFAVRFFIQIAKYIPDTSNDEELFSQEYTGVDEDYLPFD